MRGIDRAQVIDQLKRGIEDVMKNMASLESHITTQTMLQGGVEKLFELHLLESLNRIPNPSWVFVSQYNRVDIVAVSSPTSAPNTSDEFIPIELKYSFSPYGIGAGPAKQLSKSGSRWYGTAEWAKCKIISLLREDLVKRKAREKYASPLAIGILISCWDDNSNPPRLPQAAKLNTIASNCLFESEKVARYAQCKVTEAIREEFNLLHPCRATLKAWNGFHAIVTMALCELRTTGDLASVE